MKLQVKLPIFAQIKNTSPYKNVVSVVGALILFDACGGCGLGFWWESWTCEGIVGGGVVGEGVGGGGHYSHVTLVVTSLV